MTCFDLHFHGAAGFRTADLTVEAYAAMSRFLAAHGTGGFLAAFSCMPHERLLDCIRFARRMHDDGLPGARLAGIYLEGPCLAVAGGMSPDQLARPSASRTAALLAAGGGLVRIMTVAPELPGIGEVIRCLADHGVTAAAGHTACTPEELENAVSAGVRHITHLGNNGEGDIRCDHGRYRHCGPLLEMLADDRLTVEVIGDGVHVDPRLVKLFYRCTGRNRFVLVTDCCAAAGIAGRTFTFRNGAGVPEPFEVRENALFTADGRLTGSLLTMDRAVENLMAFAGISREDAEYAATTLPCRIAGVNDKD